MNMVNRYVAGMLLVFIVGFALGNVGNVTQTLDAQEAKVFELRWYTSPDGLLPNLEARFRNHTMRLFEKHGMKNVGYWVPQDSPESDNTLIYIISHESRKAASDSWASFRADPEWGKVSQASQVNGQSIVSGVKSVFMESTDYSPIR